MTGLKCPNCNTDLMCGCNSCKKETQHFEGALLVWDGEDGFQKCSWCGHTMFCDDWLAVGEKQNAIQST